MSVFVDKDSSVIIQGFTGQHATFHAEEAMTFGTQDRRRRHARQGRRDPPGPAGVQLGRRGGRGDRRDRERHLRAAGDRDRLAARGGRRRDPGRRDHRRRRAGAGHGAHEALPRRALDDDHRPELAGHHHPGRVQGRDHAEPHLRDGAGRRRVALRHAELRGGEPDDGARARPIDVRRHRRRPGQRHRLQDGAAGLRERRRHRRGRDDRRDRRPAGGRGRRLGVAVHVEAARVLHRRRLGAARPADGPRRRGDRRRLRHGDGQARRDRGARPPRGAQPRRDRRHGAARRQGGRVPGRCRRPRNGLHPPRQAARDPYTPADAQRQGPAVPRQLLDAVRRARPYPLGRSVRRLPVVLLELRPAGELPRDRARVPPVAEGSRSLHLGAASLWRCSSHS